MLNEHPLTVKDSRNDEAKKHVGHTVKLMETKEKNSGLPFRRERTERFLCQKCQKIFYEYNIIEDEAAKKLIKPTEIVK